MTSPFVQRNLDLAQYAQARGSEYEGPKTETKPTYDAYAYTTLPGFTRHIHKDWLATAKIGTGSMWCPLKGECRRPWTSAIPLNP